MFTKRLKIFILLLLSAPSLTSVSAAQQLGQLFTSPAQRETLNRLRDQYQRGLYKAGEQGGEQQAYTFNGLVSKQGKVKVLWVNGNSTVPAKTRPNSFGQYQIDIPPGQVQLKPGQIYQPASASVIEAFDTRDTNESP